MKSGQNRSHINFGDKVEIVQKQHQRSGELTVGHVTKILTNSNYHPHGIKVVLDSGQIGRVKTIIS